MKIKSGLIFTAFFLIVCSPVLADGADSPVGFWKSVDDKTNKAKSVIEIKEINGILRGRILKLLNRAGKDPDPKCTKCTGVKKNKRMIGMEILYGLKKGGKEWSGGKILDPKNGKEYKCYIQVQDSGKKLKVRGFIGFSFIGRTQYWYRVPDAESVKE